MGYTIRLTGLRCNGRSPVVTLREPDMVVATTGKSNQNRLAYAGRLTGAGSISCALWKPALAGQAAQAG